MLTSQMHKKRSNGSQNKTDKKNSSSQKIVGQVSNTTSQWFGIRARTKQHIQNMQSQNGQKQRQLAGPSIANPTLKEDSQRLAIKTITNGTKSLESLKQILYQATSVSSGSDTSAPENSHQSLGIKSQSLSSSSSTAQLL